MKNHSIKVPRLYKVSAQVAKEVSEGIGSIKSLVYEKQKKHPNIKAIYAIVTTLYQKLEEIETLLKRSQILVKETRFDPWLAKVLIVELLWGKKYLPGQSKPENTIRAYEQVFKAHLSDTSTKENAFKENDSKPRYVRINTLITSLSEAVEKFQNEGWILVKFFNKNDYNGYLEKISSLNNDEFMIDIHVSNLLVFPPKTEFYRHPAYKNGSIILQDKASCLPVHILGAPSGSTVLDMCAAPGMKTTHMAAVLNNEGTVYATERHPKRFEILNTIVSNAQAKCVKTFNKDILDCTKDDFPGVEYILVDPSCSGTGMTDRPQENKINASRMSNLTGFQIKILRHALTKFPDAKKVVYSTCSILPEENEDVVRQVLETNYNFKLISASQFVDETWQNFGSPDYGEIGKFCLYAKPNKDYTNGFFVAVFERLQEEEENKFFNTRIFNFKKHIQANENWKKKKQLKHDQNKDNSDENLNKSGHNENNVNNKDTVCNVQKIKKNKETVEDFTHENKIENADIIPNQNMKRNKNKQKEDYKLGKEQIKKIFKSKENLDENYAMVQTSNYCLQSTINDLQTEESIYLENPKKKRKNKEITDDSEECILERSSKKKKKNKEILIDETINEENSKTSKKTKNNEIDPEKFNLEIPTMKNKNKEILLDQAINEESSKTSRKTKNNEIDPEKFNLEIPTKKNKKNKEILIDEAINKESRKTSKKTKNYENIEDPEKCNLERSMKKKTKNKDILIDEAINEESTKTSKKRKNNEIQTPTISIIDSEVEIIEDTVYEGSHSKKTLKNIKRKKQMSEILVN